MRKVILKIALEIPVDVADSDLDLDKWLTHNFCFDLWCSQSSSQFKRTPHELCAYVTRKTWCLRDDSDTGDIGKRYFTVTAKG